MSEDRYVWKVCSRNNGTRAKYLNDEKENDCVLFSKANITKILNQQDQRITDLEAKLAKRDEFLKIAYEDIDELQKENDKLEQQLAEKEKEIRGFEAREKARLFKVDQQDKISFAVEQLDKVKEFCNNPKNRVEYEYCPNAWTYAVDKDKLMLEIDNQIKEIKGE